MFVWIRSIKGLDFGQGIDTAMEVMEQWVLGEKSRATLKPSSALKGQVDIHIAVGHLVAHEESLAMIVPLQQLGQVTIPFGSNLSGVLVELSSLARLIGPSDLADGSEEVLSALVHHIDVCCLLVVGSVQVVVSRNVSNDARTLNNVESSLLIARDLAKGQLRFMLSLVIVPRQAGAVAEGNGDVVVVDTSKFKEQSCAFSFATKMKICKSGFGYASFHCVYVAVVLVPFSLTDPMVGLAFPQLSTLLSLAGPLFGLIPPTGVAFLAPTNDAFTRFGQTTPYNATSIIPYLQYHVISNPVLFRAGFIAQSYPTLSVVGTTPRTVALTYNGIGEPLVNMVTFNLTDIPFVAQTLGGPVLGSVHVINEVLNPFVMSTTAVTPLQTTRAVTASPQITGGSNTGSMLSANIFLVALSFFIAKFM